MGSGRGELIRLSLSPSCSDVPSCIFALRRGGGGKGALRGTVVLSSLFSTPILADRAAAIVAPRSGCAFVVPVLSVRVLLGMVGLAAASMFADALCAGVGLNGFGLAIAGAARLT